MPFPSAGLEDAINGGFWQLFAETGVVARIVLGILLFASIYSWAVILRKLRTFKQAKIQNQAFLRIFRQSRKLSEVRDSYHLLRDCPLVGVFENGYREIENQVVISENPGKPRIKSVMGVQRALQIAASSQLTQLENRVHGLATIGSTTPFIGLFGTVWGIIDAFQGLSTGGAASLRSVAPGISEALIATAAGLFAAIPAVIAYNQFVQRIKEFAAQMDDFGLEFINMTERNFT
jgi:biopolymer transport protein TolQ